MSQKEIEVILTRQLASYLAMPILIVDERLYECAKDLNLFKEGFREIIAITKDIKNKNFYLWLNNNFKKNDKQLEIEL